MAKAHFTLAQGTLPSNATKAGNEADGTALYVARAEYEGGHHPGKYRKGWRAASISYGGREVWVPAILRLDRSTDRWKSRAVGADPCGGV